MGKHWFSKIDFKKNLVLVCLFNINVLKGGWLGLIFIIFTLYNSLKVEIDNLWVFLLKNCITEAYFPLNEPSYYSFSHYSEIFSSFSIQSYDSFKIWDIWNLWGGFSSTLQIIQSDKIICHSMCPFTIQNLNHFCSIISNCNNHTPSNFLNFGDRHFIERTCFDARKKSIL